MVEKFNFYDIYGYLIPGLFLTGLLWLPFGVLWHVWPKAEFSSAILVLLFAYILGHFLQSLRIPTSDMQDKQGCWRHPSNVLLDEDNSSLAHETKQKIEELSRQHFKIEVNKKNKDDAKDTQKHIDNRREVAFFQARSALLKNKGEKTSVYWEQFEGLYAMMRNVMLASAASACYFLGWCASYMGHWDRLFPRRLLAIVLIVAVVLAFLTALLLKKIVGMISWVARRLQILLSEEPTEPAGKTEAVSPHLDKRGCAKKSWEEVWDRRITKGLAASLAFAAFFAGGLIAQATTISGHAQMNTGHILCCTTLIPCQPDEVLKDEPQIKITVGHPAWLMFVLALAASVVAGRTYRAYKAFAKEFALAIWRDFANFEVAPPQPATSNTNTGIAK